MAVMRPVCPLQADPYKRAKGKPPFIVTTLSSAIRDVLASSERRQHLQ